MNVAIYMEGGGGGKESKAALRIGMQRFLGEFDGDYKRRGWRLDVIPCGPRNEAYHLFQNARRKSEVGIVVLLVDSESQVAAGAAPIDHLVETDQWDFQGVDGDAVHLMVQTMETWVVADPSTLRAYYGPGFQARFLPRQGVLEEVSKEDIAKALNRATQGTKKGKYHKIRHASEILQRMNPNSVRPSCPHCDRFFTTIVRLVNQTPSRSSSSSRVGVSMTTSGKRKPSG